MSQIYEELPYAYVVSSSKANQYCCFCLCRSQNLSRCSKCKLAHFCSMECQKSGWKDHKPECDRLQFIYPKVPTDTARLIARILFKNNSEQSGNSEPSSVRTIDNLMPHVDEIRNDFVRMEHFAQISFILKEYLGENFLPTGQELLEIYGKIVVNCFNIVNDDMNSVGVGLYIGLSELDHSCNPDCFVTFRGPKACLMSADGRKVPFEPKKLKISYIELMAPTSERQSQLQSQYYFTCQCSKCTDLNSNSLMNSFRCSELNCTGVSILDESYEVSFCQTCGHRNENLNECLRAGQLVKWNLEKLDSLFNAGEFQSLYDEGLKTLLQCDQHLNELNVYRIRLLDKIFDACLELEKFDEALTFIVQTIDAYSLHYPKFHPSSGLQLLKLGKLQLYKQRFNEALITLRKAESIICVSFGRDSSMYATVADLMNQCCEEMRMQLNQRHSEEQFNL